MNRVCFKSSHLLLGILGAVVVAVQLALYLQSRVGKTAVHIPVPGSSMSSSTQPAVIAVQAPGPPQTVIVQKDTNRHTADSWPLAPRGNFGYYTRPVYPPVQTGLLTGTVGDQQVVLPLYSRQSPNRSNRYQYFTKSDTYNPQDLAIVYKNRNCTQELGCDEIFDKEEVRIPAYNDTIFKVSLYPNN
jgi:hypothetical protein